MGFEKGFETVLKEPSVTHCNALWGVLEQGDMTLWLWVQLVGLFSETNEWSCEATVCNAAAGDGQLVGLDK